MVVNTPAGGSPFTTRSMFLESDERVSFLRSGDEVGSDSRPSCDPPPDGPGIPILNMGLTVTATDLAPRSCAGRCVAGRGCISWLCGNELHTSSPGPRPISPNRRNRAAQ